MKLSAIALQVIFISSLGWAQTPFLSQPEWVALRKESNGAAPYENLRYLTTLHRVPATREFDQAAKFIEQRAREYGLQNVTSEEFPADGKTTYGLMRAYLGWSVEAGSLWEVRPQHVLIGDWATDPIRLADYSHSADVETALIDVGDGTSDSDYEGKDVRGKIVLADGVLSRVQEMAIVNRGAAGIVSDMPNQTTAWSGLDRTLVRWGHLEARIDSGFAFMVSRETAESLRSSLRAGDQIVLNAHVKAEVGPSHWTVVNGVIPGSDPSAGEVVFSCHLDHERPGANDNGSGCVTILEGARMLSRLIGGNALSRPRRTLRFVWGPEIEGTMAYLARHPEIRRQFRANVHMDMVGGDPFKNKSVFHVTSTPWSLPSFVTDTGASFMELIRSGAAEYAGSGSNSEAAVIENRAGDVGTRNEFWADVTPYANGSDHEAYDSSTIAVPSLYLRDWPDIYLHTDHDSLAQIDASKLRRVALLGAASGYVYAAMDQTRAKAVLPALLVSSQIRLASASQQAQQLLQGASNIHESWYEARNLLKQALAREIGELRSLAMFAGAGFSTQPEEGVLSRQIAAYASSIDTSAREKGITAKSVATPPWASDPNAAKIPQRVGDFGPLTYQNDDVLRARLGVERYSKIKLLNPAATRLLSVEDQGDLYAYEIINFVDGQRSVGEIRDAVSAEYGPITTDLVADYLQACTKANVIKWK